MFFFFLATVTYVVYYHIFLKKFSEYKRNLLKGPKN